MRKFPRRIGVAGAATLVVLLAACQNPVAEGPEPDPISGLIYPVAPGPLDGVLTVLVRPTLAWSAPAGAASYELQYSVGDEAALSESVATATSAASFALLSDLPWMDAPVPVFWRVRAKNPAGAWGAWSENFSFAYTPHPDGYAGVPAAGSATADRTPLIDWDDLHGAAEYRIQVCMAGDQVDAPGSVADQTGLTASQYELLSEIPLAGVRYWRIACRPEGGEWSAFGGWRSFSVEWSSWTSDMTADGATGFDSTPVVSWTAVADAADYLVLVAASAEGLEAATPGAVPHGDLSYELAEPIPLGEFRYWSLVPVNAEGDRGPASTPRAIGASGDYSATPVAPVEGTEAADTAVTLSWQALEGAVAYEVEVAVNGAAFTGTPTHAGLVSIMLDLTVPRGSAWNWRVRAVNEDGNQSAWAGPFPFSVAWSYSVIAATPMDTFDQSPDLDWSDVSDGVGACSWQIAAFRDAAAVASSKLTGGNRTATASALSWATLGIEIMDHDTTPLYWSVRPLNSEGVPGPAWFDFSTQAKYPALTALSPADGAVVDGEVVLDWQVVPGALNYDLVVGTTSAAVSAASTPTHAAVTADELALVGIPVGAARWWKFRVRNDDGTLYGWSAVSGFTTRWVVAYTGLSPADGFVTFDETPTLDWDDVAGAAGYKIAMGLTNEAALNAQANPAALATVPTSTYTHPGISYGSTLYWSVVAVNSEGTMAPSWSPILSLAISAAFTPTQLAPANGASVADTTPTLECEPIEGAAGYVFTVAASEFGWGTAIMYPSDFPCLTLDAIPSGESRWWKVYAYGTYGDKSLSSAIWSFTVE